MTTYKTFDCKYCSATFQRELRQCHKKTKHHFCCKICADAFQNIQKEIACLECGIKVFRKLAEFKKSNSHFCSRRCSGVFNNRRRKLAGYSTKNKTKLDYCSRCKCEIEISIHSPTKQHKMLCNKCKEEVRPTRHGSKQEDGTIHRSRPTHTKLCEKCGGSFEAYSKDVRFCSRPCVVSSSGYIKNLSEKATERILTGKVNTNSGTRCSFKFAGKEIRCDSILEYSCLSYFMKNFSIFQIERCSFYIPYQYNSKSLRYIPDFLITTNEAKYIIECKSWVGNNLNKKWKNYLEKSPLKRVALEKYSKEHNLIAIWFSTQENSKFRKHYSLTQKEFRKLTTLSSQPPIL